MNTSHSHSDFSKMYETSHTNVDQR